MRRWPTFEERFFARVKFTDACWEWTSFRERNGYARVKDTERSGRRELVHRLMYERIHGPIPGDLTVDHLCRNRVCVRPEHLELVSRAENTLRGKTVTAENLTKTHCPRGHPYDMVAVSARRSWRACRECHNATARRYKARQAALRNRS